VGPGAAGGDHAPKEVLDFLPQMRRAAPEAYLIAKPNAGVPRMVNRRAVYDASPERMAELARQYFEMGASIVGACCGSSPGHIAAMARAIKGASEV
jgi:5-methyltetrahydrofolate--homocysteine methyltransferase